MSNLQNSDSKSCKNIFGLNDTGIKLQNKDISKNLLSFQTIVHLHNLLVELLCVTIFVATSSSSIFVATSSSSLFVDGLSSFGLHCFIRSTHSCCFIKDMIFLFYIPGDRCNSKKEESGRSFVTLNSNGPFSKTWISSFQEKQALPVAAFFFCFSNYFCIPFSYPRVDLNNHYFILNDTKINHITIKRNFFLNIKSIPIQTNLSPSPYQNKTGSS